MDETYTPQTEEPEKDFDQQIDEALALGNAHSQREPGSVESAAEIARRQLAQDYDTSIDTRPAHPVRNAVIGTAVVGGLLAIGVTGLANEQGGNANGAERGDTDTTIESITLNPDANLRFDPYAGEGEDNNRVLSLGAQITIDADHDIRVLEGTNNGTWYGISLEDVKEIVPSVDTTDKDGIIWVNEQGVESIDRTELTTE